jgi:hypothetical protein
MESGDNRILKYLLFLFSENDTILSLNCAV